MVAKISTGGNMFGALAYNQNKVDSEEAKVLFSNRMLLSEDGHFSIGECMRSFEMQMPVQLSTKKPILHISINPHPEDVLTDQQLSDIAREYMRKLGYGDQPYLVYKHTDIDRHHIHIVGLRVDESLYFANARYLEDHVAAQVASHPQVRHVVLQCSAVNDIDASALESLEAIAERLHDAGVTLHLSEVKGPVMDTLKRSDFLDHLCGQVFLTHHQAITALGAE